MTDKQLFWCNVRNVLAYAMVTAPFTVGCIVVGHFVVKFW